MNIKELYEPVREGIERVNEKLNEIFKKDYFPYIPDNLLMGKRLRPLLTLYSSFAFEDLKEEKVDVACATELVHFASLIHDDVVDGSTIRRKSLTLNFSYGNHTAILIGDYVFSKAMEFIGKAKNVRLFEILTKTSVEMCEGEIIDEFLDREKRFDLKNYLLLIEKKTASLFSACCEMGGIIVNYKYVESLKKFGKKFGILFQILDDLFDFYKEGEDIEKGKITLPHILFKEEIEKKFPEFFKEKNFYLSKKVREFLLEKGVMERCYEYLIPDFLELKKLVSELDNPIKNYLYSFIIYLEENRHFLFNEEEVQSP